MNYQFSPQVCPHPAYQRTYNYESDGTQWRPCVHIEHYVPFGLAHPLCLMCGAVLVLSRKGVRIDNETP